MGQAAAVVQQGLAGIPLFFVLLLAVILSRLVSPGILEFKGKEGQAVQENHHIYLVSGIKQGEGLLTGNRELIFGIFGVAGLAVGR